MDWRLGLAQACGACADGAVAVRAQHCVPAPSRNGFAEQLGPVQLAERFLEGDAEGDEVKLRERLEAMINSVNRFIDLTSLEIVPTSEFNF